MIGTKPGHQTIRMYSRPQPWVWVMEDFAGLWGGWGQPGEGWGWQAHREDAIYQTAQKNFDFNDL